MSAIDHYHTYRRIKNTKDRYKCLHPDCTHTSTRELIMGKRASCPVCGLTFIITWKTLRLVRLHCDDCVGSKQKRVDKEKEFVKISNRLDTILNQFKNEGENI